MSERLLEIYDWETSTPEDQQDQSQLFELESTTAMEQPALVRDVVEQSPQIHAFETLEESEQQKKKQIAEESDPTPLSTIQNNSTLHSFDSTLFQI